LLPMAFILLIVTAQLGIIVVDRVRASSIPLEKKKDKILTITIGAANPRPYAETLTPAEAMKGLKRCTGTQCDPQVVEVFENIMKNETP